MCHLFKSFIAGETFQEKKKNYDWFMADLDSKYLMNVKKLDNVLIDIHEKKSQLDLKRKSLVTFISIEEAA